MSDIEQAFLNKIKVVGDGEYTLLGTPDELIKELESVLVEAKKDQVMIDFDWYLLETATPENVLIEIRERILQELDNG